MCKLKRLLFGPNLTTIKLIYAFGLKCLVVELQYLHHRRVRVLVVCQKLRSPIVNGCALPHTISAHLFLWFTVIADCCHILSKLFVTLFAYGPITKVPRGCEAPGAQHQASIVGIFKLPLFKNKIDLSVTTAAIDPFFPRHVGDAR